MAGVLLGCGSEGEPGPIVVGGLYQGFENTSGGSTPPEQYYLKFSDERTVLNTVSADPPDMVRTWFNRGHENVNSEKYELDGNHVVINYDLGSTYDGTIDGDRIFFKVTSLGTPPMYVRSFKLLR
ncbi:MAG TPA: hypothetical protein VHB79_02880 [Polyangiaceae bacterium]|nr:hypothetical protein [Polyangiaceae bacterium]